MTNMCKMNTCPVWAGQRQKFKLPVGHRTAKQLGVESLELHSVADWLSLCFVHLIFLLSTLAPLMGSFFFFFTSCCVYFFFSSLLSTMEHCCVYDLSILAQKSLLMTVSMEMWKNMPVSEEVIVCFYFSLIFVSPPKSTLLWAMCLVGST